MKGGTHTEGHDTQTGQHVNASSTSVKARSRDTAAVLNPIAKGNAIANSSSSQLLSYASSNAFRGLIQDHCARIHDQTALAGLRVPVPLCGHSLNTTM